jgi:nucleotide-binding universal stress UspA family protein
MSTTSATTSGQPSGFAGDVVLAALDDSPAARPVAEFALSLGRLLRCRAEAVHVGTVTARTATATAEAVGLPCRNLPGEPVTAIADAVEAPAVRLAVLGAHRLPGSRGPIGGTALAVAQRVSKPVVVVPPDYRPADAVRRLVLPLSGAPDVAALVAATVHAATENLVEVVALHVFDAQTVPRCWDQPQHEEPAWREEFLARFTPAVPVRLLLRTGSVAAAVNAVVHEEQADLVVLAWAQDVSPGHGEVVRQVLAEVAVPVTLVPAQPRLLDLSGLTEQPVASRPGAP